MCSSFWLLLALYWRHHSSVSVPHMWLGVPWTDQLLGWRWAEWAWRARRAGNSRRRGRAAQPPRTRPSAAPSAMRCLWTRWCCRAGMPLTRSACASCARASPPSTHTALPAEHIYRLLCLRWSALPSAPLPRLAPHDAPSHLALKRFFVTNCCSCGTNNIVRCLRSSV